MPVTIHPSSRTPEPARLPGYARATSAEQLLASITTDDEADGSSPNKSRARHRRDIVQSSFSTLSRTTSTTYAAKNGLVFACLEAYNNHHNLVLRPDDIWIAILTQLSAHLNANATTLRSLLLHGPPAGQGQGQGEDGAAARIQLHIEPPRAAHTDHGAVAAEMAALLSAELRDPSLLDDFVLPRFSTTAPADVAAACVALLGAMQKHFVYSWGTRCGIPAVRLLGSAEDWAGMARRCEAVLGAGRLGQDAARWYRDALRGVLDGFAECFRDPRGERARAFWRAVVDRDEPDGSGKVGYSGWVTAFTWWDEEGRCLHSLDSGGRGVVRSLERGQVPMGFVKVPVTLVDKGLGRETEMVAGSVGIRVRRWAEGDDEEEEEGRGDEGSARWERESGDLDTIQPESGWFMHYV